MDDLGQQILELYISAPEPMRKRMILSAVLSACASEAIKTVEKETKEVQS